MASPVSDAFRPWLDRARKDETLDAILVYRSSAPGARLGEPPTRPQSRVLRRERFGSSLTTPRLLTDRIQDALSRHLPPDIARIQRQHSERTANTDHRTLPFEHLKVTRSLLRELSSYDDVIAVIPNQPVKLLEPTKVEYKSATPSERRGGATWGLTRLRIPQLWAKAKTKGERIKVAVLDTGVYAEHAALSNKVSEFVLVDPLGRTIETNQPFDGGSHGTHVCGTLVGGTDPDGVAIGGAPNAELIVAAVLAGDATLSTIVAGIEWAVRQRADVISMSFGMTYYEPMFEEVLRPLWDRDILPVVAIGNENHGNTSSPGNVSSAFSVGATAGTRVAPFSGGASLDWPGTPQPRTVKPDVVAPGVQTYSCIPPTRGRDYAKLDGTSMATPHVAAVAALLMSSKPNATAIDIANAIRITARHPDGQSHRPDNRWGWGEVRPLAALKAL